jgi:hypothetical protein
MVKPTKYYLTQLRFIHPPQLSNNKHPVDDGWTGGCSWFAVALFLWRFPFGGKKFVNKKYLYTHTQKHGLNEETASFSYLLLTGNAACREGGFI